MDAVLRRFRLLGSSSSPRPVARQTSAPPVKETPPVPPRKALPKIPLAVWHRVIAHVLAYANQLDHPSHAEWLRTFHRCGGVCKAWRARVNTFSGQPELHVNTAFADLIANTFNRNPVFWATIRKLQILCSAETSTGALGYQLNNAATHFPAALAPQTVLPHLEEIHIYALLRASGASPAVPEGTELLPHLPLPPDFPSLYARWAGQIKILDIGGITFAEFSDLNRLIECFPLLEDLKCACLRWSELGVVPESMELGRGSFLGKLQCLQVRFFVRGWTWR